MDFLFKKSWGFFLLFVPTLVMADTSTWEIYTYGNNKSYYDVFNAVSITTASDTMKDLIRTVMLLGVMGSLFVTAVFKLPEFVRWVVQSMAVFWLVMTPTAGVVITDKLNQDGPYSISNVPVFLAVGASITTIADYWMTDKMEALLSVPGGFRVSGSGFRFGQKALTNAISSSSIKDKVLYSDLVQYVRDCVVPEIANDPQYDAALLGGAGDPWAALWAIANVARPTQISLPVMDASGNSSYALAVTSCKDAAIGGSAGGLALVGSDQALKVRLQKELSSVQAYLGRMTRPYLTDDAKASTAFKADMDLVETAFIKSSLGSSNSLALFAFNNFWNSSNGDIAAMMNNPAEVQLLTTKFQSEAQAINSYRVQGRISVETLPRVRNIIQLIIFCLFPFMCVYAVSAGDKAIIPIRAYFGGMVWVSLWSPLFAIANYFGIVQDANILVYILSPGISPENQAAAYVELAKAEADYGMIVASIPVIAGIMAKGFDFAGAGLADKMMSNWGQPVAKMAGVNALGNQRVLNWGDGTHTQAAQGGLSTKDGYGGVGLTTSAQGTVTSVDGANFKIGVGQAVARENATNASRSEAAAYQSQQAYEEARSAAIADTYRFGEQERRSASDTVMHSKGYKAADQKTFNDMAELSRSAKEDLGFNEKQTAQLMANVKAGVKNPFEGITGVKVDINAAASAGGAAEKARTLATSLASKGAESISRAESFGTDYAMQLNAQSGTSADKAVSKDLSANLQRMRNAKDAETLALDQKRSFEQNAKLAHSNSEKIDHDSTTAVFNTLESQVGRAEAKRIFDTLNRGEILSDHDLNHFETAKSSVAKNIVANSSDRIVAPTNTVNDFYNQYQQNLKGTKDVNALFAAGKSDVLKHGAEHGLSPDGRGTALRVGERTDEVQGAITNTEKRINEEDQRVRGAEQKNYQKIEGEIANRSVIGGATGAAVGYVKDVVGNFGEGLGKVTGISSLQDGGKQFKDQGTFQHSSQSDFGKNPNNEQTQPSAAMVSSEDKLRAEIQRIETEKSPVDVPVPERANFSEAPKSNPSESSAGIPGEQKGALDYRSDKTPLAERTPIVEGVAKAKRILNSASERIQPQTHVPPNQPKQGFKPDEPPIRHLTDTSPKPTTVKQEVVTGHPPAPAGSEEKPAPASVTNQQRQPGKGSKSQPATTVKQEVGHPPAVAGSEEKPNKI